MPELPPNPQLLLNSLRSTGYTLKSAVADVIDNSISAQASEIAIRFKGDYTGNKPWIAICDNGEGMDRETLFQSMKFGSRELDSERGGVLDLGRFGLGMKTASISQCRKLTVFSWQNNICSALCWDLDKITTTWEIIELNAAEIEGHGIIQEIINSLDFNITKSGTVVLWEVLDRDALINQENMNDSMDEVATHISEVFHRFMQKEVGHDTVIRFTMNGRVIEPLSPFGPNVQCKYILKNDSFKCHGHTVKYQPYILPRAIDYEKESDYTKYGGKQGYLQNQGFYIYRNRRLIEKATWFRKLKKEYKTQLLRIQLDIPAELDEFWGIDVRKSQTTPPLDVQDKVCGIVESAMKEARKHWDCGTGNIKITQDSLDPIWAIKAKGGKNPQYSYELNNSHPLYRLIMRNLPKEIRSLFTEYASTISETFPYDRYYSDRNQTADTKFEMDRPADERLTKMINTLCECGLPEQEIRDMLLQSETSFSPALINMYLALKFKH